MGSINVVTHNLQGMFSNRQLGIVHTNKKKSTEKLSSGYKINRAADDAAGLTISEKMRRMIRGLTQASANVQDGVSLCQVADGYLDEVHDMLHRTTELAIKGSNGTLTDDDRKAINEEVTALKKEMKRIFNVANFNEIPLFHVPYTPEITPPATDMELFHTGNGNTGGLEFNNVRYNISELQAEGFKIGDDGIATEDFKLSFSLWDGETVDISMKEGDTLDKAKRNYKWTADETGISINNKKAADWTDVTGPDGSKLTDTSEFVPGTYTFTHHGMEISFEIDEESSIDEVMAGINGDEITKPATWDVSVGDTTSKSAATILSGAQSINVTNATKDIIDHNYSVVADENGIAIKRTNPNDAADTYTSGYTAWNTFKDSSKSSITDENGNTVATNGGYPVIDWGTDNDSNSESDITFDDTARYTYAASDSNVPALSFAFGLAESASLDEVSESMSAEVSASTVYAPGQLTASGTGNYGTISVIAGPSINGSFALQRAYGRDFDDPSKNMTASINIKRAVTGRNLANDVLNLDGTYSADVDGHTLSPRSVIDTTPVTSISDASPYNETYTYYKVGDDYYKYRSYYKDEKFTNNYNIKDSWEQPVEYTFSGVLNSTDMNNISRSQAEYYKRDIYQTGTYTRTWFFADESVGKVDADSLSDDEKNRAISCSNTYDLPQYSSSLKSEAYGDYTTTSISHPTLTGLETQSYDLEFNSEKGKAFSFNYSINVDQAKSINTGALVGYVTFKPNGNAYRRFSPNTNGSISEAEFSNFKLNVPEKQLDIQAGANAGDIIRMTWSPLNLTIIGMSGVNTTTEESSRASIAMVQNALDVISETRSKFGAYQNRFEHTIRNLDNVVENTQAAESLIRDTDMSKEMVKYAKENILEQVNSSILAQANQSTQGVLSLFS